MGKVLTELNRKLTEMDVHSPTPDVSSVDLTCHLEKADKYDDIKKVVKQTLEAGLKDIYLFWVIMRTRLSPVTSIAQLLRLSFLGWD